MKIEMFPPELVQLQVEIANYHPQLAAILIISNSLKPNLGDKLAEIATYCGVMVDGYFERREIEVMAEDLRRRLVEKRTLIISH